MAIPTISSSANEFIIDISKISTDVYSNLPIHEIYSKFLSPLNKFPGYKGYAFYILNDQTFEFELKLEDTEEDGIKVSDGFADLVDEGIIGQALQSLYQTYHQNAQNQLYEYLLPLAGNSGIIGLLIVASNFSPYDIEFSLLNLLTIYTRMMASTIENHSLRIIQEKNRELMDQLVASRTLSLVESKSQLGEKIESLKSNLLMSIPHEFRTPINQILGIANYLISYFEEFYSEQSTDIHEFLDDIKVSAERLKNVFENYIYYANLSIISTSIDEVAKLRFSLTEYPDSTIFENSMLKAEKYGRNDDVEINLVNAKIAIGEEYLFKLTSEIADNCFKYSQPGEKVTINSHLEDNYYVIVFSDNGIGIDDSFLDNIDAYMQFDRKKNEQQGIGLGLSIAQKIVDLHNGKIEIKSKIGEFTRIIIKLPIAIHAEEYYSLGD